MAQSVDLSEKRYWYKETVVKFGKFKGEDYTCGQIMALEPSYLIWCDENIEWFNLDEDFRMEVEEAVEREREHKRSERRGSRGRRAPTIVDLTTGRESNGIDDDEIPF
jgi:hypothetical protein